MTRWPSASDTSEWTLEGKDDTSGVAYWHTRTLPGFRLIRGPKDTAPFAHLESPDDVLAEFRKRAGEFSQIASQYTVVFGSTGNTTTLLPALLGHSRIADVHEGNTWTEVVEEFRRRHLLISDLVLRAKATMGTAEVAITSPAALSRDADDQVMPVLGDPVTAADRALSAYATSYSREEVALRVPLSDEDE